MKKFTTVKDQVEVEIDGQVYTVMEMSGTQRDAFLKTIRAKLNVKDNTDKIEVSSTGGVQVQLIATCLQDTNGVAVIKETIQEWPSKLITGLFEICQEVNGIGEKAEAETVKN